MGPLTDEPGTECPVDVAISPDNRLLAVSYLGDYTEVWSLANGVHLETFYTRSYPMDLSFSSDGTYLETNYGDIEIGHLLEGAQHSSHSSGFRWWISGDWLMQGSRKMLWLPPDIRRIRCAYRDGIFAFRPKSGEITFLEVDLNYRPPQ